MSKIFPKAKKALITTPSDSPISIAFFSNSIVQDFQENSDDEADKRSIEEYLRDLELEFHKRALLAIQNVERYNPDSKLLIFNRGTILILESQAVNECLQLTKVPTDHESSKGSGLEPQNPLPPIKNLQGAYPFSKVMTLTYRDHSLRERPGLGKSSQFGESSVGVSCTTGGSNVHSTTNHNDFEHFKRAERKNRTLIEAGRIMLNGSVFSKHVWTEAVRIVCYTHNRSIIVKRHDKTPYEISRERIHDINYFHIFGCHVFIHNHKDHLGKFNAKADDEYFLGYSFVSKALRVYNTRRQQIEETYHITIDESMESIRIINTYQSTEESSGNNTKTSVPITEPLVPEVPQSPITHHASTSILTRSMVVMFIAASASECLFADFLSKIEPKKVSDALKHLGWVDAMQEELNQFYRNKVWTLVPLPYEKIAIGSK
ncbi:retrovirus-related pol polyprotein from transposon TNT 1-94 [Tanacetum coccineum]